MLMLFHRFLVLLICGLLLFILQSLYHTYLIHTLHLSELNCIPICFLKSSILLAPAILRV